MCWPMYVFGLWPTSIHYAVHFFYHGIELGFLLSLLSPSPSTAPPTAAVGEPPARRPCVLASGRRPTLCAPPTGGLPARARRRLRWPASAPIPVLRWPAPSSLPPIAVVDRPAQAPTCLALLLCYEDWARRPPLCLKLALCLKSQQPLKKRAWLLFDLILLCRS
jgi:hypothetical protein